MKLKKFFVEDSDGKPSITATVFLYGMIIIHFKLMFAGIEIGKFVLAPFDGADYAAAVAALGSIYVLRRSTNPVLKAEANMEIETVVVDGVSRTTKKPKAQSKVERTQDDE